MRVIFVSVALMLAFGTAMVSCTEELREDNSSFGLIQAKIFTPSCAVSGCHASSGDPLFTKHGLLLTPGKSFNALINVEPKNTAARSNGLFLVKPGSSEMSLLYHKLLRNTGHHDSEYGNPMPLGFDKISLGQLEYIKGWIDAGAPSTGFVGDADLLEDTTPQPDFFEPLPKPESGFQVQIGPFPVSPEFEREFYTYKPIGNSSDVLINRIEIKMRDNSHHLVVYDFGSNTPNAILPQVDQIRDIRRTDGSLIIENLGVLGFHSFIAGSQMPYQDFRFPPGVGFKITAGMKLDFNPHYVNKGKEILYGEAQVNFHTTEASSVLKIAKAINWGNRDIELPPQKRTTLSKTFTTAKRIKVFALTSHTHQLGEKFQILISGGARNGELVYESTDWHHPENIQFDPPIVLEPGQGLTSVITYNNTTNTTVNFGLLSVNEMGIIFGYYYED